MQDTFGGWCHGPVRREGLRGVDRPFRHRGQGVRRLINHYYFYLRDHLHLGRLDMAMVKVMFDRRITKKTPSRFQTRVLRQGVVSCLKVFYKKSFLKQYNKEGRVLRTEVCINDPGDFGVRKSLVHLGYRGTIAHHALRRFSKAQAEPLEAAELTRGCSFVVFPRVMIDPSQWDGSIMTHATPSER